jgi:hypothetical protein
MKSAIDLLNAAERSRKPSFVRAEIEGYTALIFSTYGSISLRSLSLFEPKNTLMIFDKISISLIFVILLAVSSHLFITHISRKYTKKLVITTLLLQKIDKRVALGERVITPWDIPKLFTPWMIMRNNLLSTGRYWI